MAGPEVIPALARGAFVPDAVSGRVLSRHAYALNVIDEPSGLLVSLLVREEDMTAMGVLVPRLPLAGSRRVLGSSPLRRLSKTKPRPEGRGFVFCGEEDLNLHTFRH